jgi:hypothetical protein
VSAGTVSAARAFSEELARQEEPAGKCESGDERKGFHLDT